MATKDENSSDFEPGAASRPPGSLHSGHAVEIRTFGSDGLKPPGQTARDGLPRA
jgi:hypothetical protein